MILSSMSCECFMHLEGSKESAAFICNYLRNAYIRYPIFGKHKFVIFSASSINNYYIDFKFIFL